MYSRASSDKTSLNACGSLNTSFQAVPVPSTIPSLSIDIGISPNRNEPFIPNFLPNKERESSPACNATSTSSSILILCLKYAMMAFSTGVVAPTEGLIPSFLTIPCI